MRHNKRAPVGCGGDAIEVELATGVGSRTGQRQGAEGARQPGRVDRHEVERRLRRIGEPRSVLGDHHVVDERLARCPELVRRDGRSGDGVEHVALAAEATGDEEQPTGVVDLEAHCHLTGRRVDEPLNSATLQIAPVDVAAEEFSGIEGGTTAKRDALGRTGVRQDDDISGRRGHSQWGDPGDRQEADQANRRQESTP